MDAHNTNSRVLRKVAAALGVKISWHVFRHTHATLSEQIGMSRSDRIAMMGHAGAMVDRYTHSDIERRRAGVDEIAGRLFATAAAGGAVQ